MTRAKATTEPSDGEFAVWFDRHGTPGAVYWRADRFSDTEGGVDRWLRADRSGCDSGEPWAWDDLCREMDGWDGPYLLILAGGQP